ncbi:MAG: hypothetical protein WC373_14690 [Smithella sp.]
MKIKLLQVKIGRKWEWVMGYNQDVGGVVTTSHAILAIMSNDLLWGKEFFEDKYPQLKFRSVIRDRDHLIGKTKDLSKMMEERRFYSADHVVPIVHKMNVEQKTCNNCLHQGAKKGRRCYDCTYEGDDLPKWERLSYDACAKMTVGHDED